jgi:hypothetical protein
MGRITVHTWLLGLGIALFSSTGALAADDRLPVTITGCVIEGNGNTFVMTYVEEISAGTRGPSSALYWLSTTKGLKAQAGHRIEVSGTYSPSRDAGKTAKVKLESDPATDKATVAVENGMKKAEFTREFRAVGTSGVKAEIEKPYRRLEVESIRMIAPSCP